LPIAVFCLTKKTVIHYKLTYSLKRQNIWSPSTVSSPCHVEESYVLKEPWGLNRQELKLLVGPPLPDRPRIMGQTKNDKLVFQVEGCADGLVTLVGKINIYSHFTIALT
jgi:hypothetical protein